MQCAIRVLDIAFGWNLDYASILIWLMYILAVFIIAIVNRLVFSRIWQKLFDNIVKSFTKPKADSSNE